MSHESSVGVLADKLDIATEFWDWKGRYTKVSLQTILAVLSAMGIDTSSEETLNEAIAQLDLKPWRRGLPPVVVVTQGKSAHIEAHVAEGHPAQIRLRLENGDVRYLGQRHHLVPPREVDGTLLGEASFSIPEDLPTGYHRLELLSDDRQAESTLIITPRFLGLPARLGDRRLWGYGAQLYSVRSQGSWGIGDFQDLSDLSVWAATQHHSDYVLINPLHAGEVVPPMEPSPYLPSSRIFLNPIYLRPEAIKEYATLCQDDRDAIAKLHDELLQEVAGEKLINRDLAWKYTKQALQIIYRSGLRPARKMAFEEFKRCQGRKLLDFSMWCVLCEHYGGDWREWDADLQRPSSPRVARLREDYRDELNFNQWMQWISWEQLSDAQQAAQDAGMAVGIVTDLTVGVGRSSADTWMMHDIYAEGVSVGAPPDGYNQIGQDWGQPPWRADRLVDTAYAPFRSMLHAALGHAGGLRIDHILGMFRLWWIPDGMSPREGTYVRVDHNALIGIIMLEAERAGAFVVGEDLGTVEPWVRDYLAERGILGTSVLWFENGPDGQPLPPERWRRSVMASVTTHDLPPTAGCLANEHVRLRHELGLLTESFEEEEAIAYREQSAWMRRLEDLGLLTDQGGGPHHEIGDVEAKILALYRYITLTEARVLNVALVDAVGDYQIQNQPGICAEYPNWQIPLSGPDGQPLTLEQLYKSRRPMHLASILNGFERPQKPFATGD